MKDPAKDQTKPDDKTTTEPKDGKKTGKDAKKKDTKEPLPPK